MKTRDNLQVPTLSLSEKIKRKIKSDKEIAKKKKTLKVVKFHPSNMSLHANQII